MAWSTRELAELAGTSVRAVRHYHQVGLLAEPERRSNGYKRYGVTHLVRLLRIKRLTDLGFTLAQIEAMGDGDEHPGDALRTLDAELAETIERLQRVRAELATILRESAPTDLPPDIGAATRRADLSAADRAFMVVMTRVLDPTGLSAYAQALQANPTEHRMPEFENLSADADELTRNGVAEGMLPYVRRIHAEYPAVFEAQATAPNGAPFAQQTIIKALLELYNPAQLDVLARLEKLRAERPQ